MKPFQSVGGIKKSLIILVAMVIVAASIVIVFYPDPEARIILKKGDMLYYDITTNRANETKTTEGTIEVFDASKDSLGTTGGYYPANWDREMEFSLDPIKMPSDPEPGFFVMNQKIDTLFGWKGVATYIESKFDWTVITDLGLESDIIYRRTYVSIDYSVQVVLVGTNNRNIWVSDQVYWDVHIEGGGKVTEEPSRNYVGAGDMWTFGNLGIGPDENLKYNLRGAFVFGLIMSMDDIMEMDRTGVLCYQEDLSIIGANGSVDHPIIESMYWFWFGIRSTDTCEGLAEYYWAYTG